MNRKTLKIFFMMFLFCILPINTKAISWCSNNEKASLKKLATNINVSYNYKINNNKATFDVTISNLLPNMYFIAEDGNKYYSNTTNNGEITFYNLVQGHSFRFDVYGNGVCDDELLYTFYATTPTYNRFYNLNVCENAKEYKLCQRWVKHELTQNEFINEVKNYINDRDKNINIEEENKINPFSYVLNFIQMYYIHIIVIIAVIIITIKFIKYKKDTFGF